MNKTRPEGVLLVGSVPYDNCSDVFRNVSRHLGKHIRRMPDGETGERKNWVDWQFKLLLDNPDLEMVDNDAFEYNTQVKMVRMKPGRDEHGLELDELGYSAAAIDSYAVFSELKSSGSIPEHVRFQVSLPTPLSTTHLYVHPSLQQTFGKKYQAALLRELGKIVENIPADELAIQWDAAVEFMLLERLMPTYLQDIENEINDILVNIGESVPGSVELGYHLCYGDSGHKHFCEPEDMSKLVGVANRLSNTISRKINWIHMPVPRNRLDEDYYRPLQTLDIQKGTELYLGLVHNTDGIPGSTQRIELASKYVPEFGVATECGFGRRPVETLATLMDYHTRLSSPVVGSVTV